MPLLIAALTFVVVVAVVFALWLLFNEDSDQKMVRSRMDAVRKIERGGGTETELALRLMRDDMLSSVPLINRILLRVAWSVKLQQFIAQAGLEMKPAKVLQLCGISALLGYIIVAHFVHIILVALAIGILCAGIPIAVIAYLRNRRLQAFEQNFPEALDLLGRAVRAGHAFTTALEMISNETTEPLAGEFRKLYEEQKFGMPVRDALMNLTERVPLVDVKFFVTAVMLQRETGGNLAEILDNLSYVIRERFKIQRQVKVHTAQGRLTMALLMGMPPAVVAILSVFSPEFVKPLFYDPIGHALLVASITLQTMGYFVIRKIIKIQV